MRKIIVLAVVLLVAHSLNIVAQLPPTTPPNTAEEIMKRIINKEKENNALKQKYISFKKISEIYSLEGNKGATLKNKEVALVHPEGDISVEDIVEKNGKPVKIRSKSSFPPNINEKLAGRYIFSMSQPEIQLLDGQPVTVINMFSKPNAPSHGRADDIANAMSGIIYIDLENFYTKKLEAGLTRKKSWAWGLVSVEKLDISFEQKIFNNIIVVKSITAVYKYSILGIETYDKRVFTYSDYSYIAPQPRQ